MHNRISLTLGDITRMEVDAVVNAANSSLMGGGGVDGAIHRAGGPSILEECKKIVARQGGCPTGEAVITGAGRLPARFVIHTVGPVWKNGTRNEEDLLSRCYSNSLQLAVIHQIKSIAFPNISTGVYGYPKKEAAETALRVVVDFLQKNRSIQQVYFVCFDEENHKIYRTLMQTI